MRWGPSNGSTDDSRGSYNKGYLHWVSRPRRYPGNPGVSTSPRSTLNDLGKDSDWMSPTTVRVTVSRLLTVSVLP